MVTKTLKHNSIQTGFTIGLDFDANNETWIINPHVIVSSQMSAGVFSSFFVNNTLKNYGRISAPGPGAVGVLLDGGNISVLNAAHGKIVGGGNGVFLNGSGNDVLDNLGTIIGKSNEGVDFFPATTGALLNNHGSIFGLNDGVFEESNSTGGTINNFKTISSPAVAIEVDTAHGLVTHITNAAGALIKGASLNNNQTGAAINGQTGSFHLVNWGTIKGDVVDADGAHDVIVNHGTIDGNVDLGTGNCTYNGTGGYIFGEIIAGGNDRIIVGGVGTYVIFVSGSSTVTGSPIGLDTYFFETAPGGYIDRITNFSPGRHDTINLAFGGLGPEGRLAAAEFGVGTQATTASQHIIYNPKNGHLYYDPDGNGPQAEIQFATLSPHLHLSHNDFFVI